MRLIASCLIALALVASITGCGGYDDQTRAMQAHYAKQLAEADQRSKRYDERMDKVDQQTERYEALLVRWEQQANRFDRILEKWEQADVPEQH